jgi:ribosomal protein S18 acetylase RimI-like enzyme
MTEGLVIRASKPEDAQALREAIDSVARERRFLALVEAPPLDAIRAFTSTGNVVRLVALSGRRIIGWADVQRMVRPGFTHRGVLGMGVVASHRRQGVGRALLDALFIESLALGVTRLELEVFRSNAGAIALYQRAGFELEGTRVGARILDGVVDDLLLMCRREEPNDSR